MLSSDVAYLLAFQDCGLLLLHLTFIGSEKPHVFYSRTLSVAYISDTLGNLICIRPLNAFACWPFVYSNLDQVFTASSWSIYARLASQRTIFLTLLLISFYSLFLGPCPPISCILSLL